MVSLSACERTVADDDSDALVRQLPTESFGIWLIDPINENWFGRRCDCAIVVGIIKGGWSIVWLLLWAIIIIPCQDFVPRLSSLASPRPRLPADIALNIEGDLDPRRLNLRRVVWVDCIEESQSLTETAAEDAATPTLQLFLRNDLLRD